MPSRILTLRNTVMMSDRRILFRKIDCEAGVDAELCWWKTVGCITGILTSSATSDAWPCLQQSECEEHLCLAKFRPRCRCQKQHRAMSLGATGMRLGNVASNFHSVSSTTERRAGLRLEPRGRRACVAVPALYGP
jgi:hypothetical protein